MHKKLICSDYGNISEDFSYLCKYILNGTKSSLFAGPDEMGAFSPVKIQSVHRNKTPCRAVHSTQSASLALDPPLGTLRAGMVLISPHEEPTASLFFQVGNH